jgi:HlyD family secretion protein
MNIKKIVIKVALSGLLLVMFSCSGNRNTGVEVVTVRKGKFIQELNEQGSLQAVNSISVGAPVISYRYGALKIAKIVEDGAEVSKGDTIMVFDPSEIKRAIIQAEQQLEIARAEYEKILSTQQSEIQDLQSDLELAGISKEIARINYETSTYEPEATKKEIQLRLESATIAVNRALEQIENKKIIHREDLIQKSLSIKQLQSTLADATNSMNNLFVVSPANGIAIKEQNWTTQQKWGVGDQPYSGSNLIELPDLDQMRAELKINEVDISKVLSGQKVEIRPDAYSDSIYTGKIESVANLAQNLDYKSKIKIFPVLVRIDGRSKALLPGLTVSCKILVNEIQDVLFVPLRAVFNEHGLDYVYVKSGNSFKRRDIKTGAVNTDYVVVEEGLNADETIALTDPFINSEENAGKVSGDKISKSALN